MLLKRTPALVLVFMATLAAAGCDLILGIFEAGFWVGVVAVVVIILLIWLIAQMFD